MQLGGAEKVLHNLLNKIIATCPQYSVHLILAKKEGILLTDLSKDIKIINCNKSHVKNCLYDLIKYFKYEKPDYFISLLDYVNIISSLAHILSRSKSRLLLWEHNTLSIQSKLTFI